MSFEINRAPATKTLSWTRVIQATDLLNTKRCGLLVSRGTQRLSWVRKFGQWDKWKGCSLTAIKMAGMRSNDDATSTQEPHSGL
ncbi:MAG: hypothetical protein ACYDC6_06295, partial [Acidobacteriaceae bacterium]